MDQEQKQKQAEAMRARWADPEFRRKQAKARKAARMAASPRKTEQTIDARPVVRVEEVTNGLSVRLDDLMATHKLAGLLTGYTDAQWYNRTIPVPTGFRIGHVILEPTK